MYTVHMKRVTATEARQNWFGLLDAVAAGEVVVIERHGRRIVLRREDPAEHAAAVVPDYSKILRVPDPDRADQWGWEWTADGVRPREDSGDSA
jgi:antitoxin (DNA-binding transcriptional repressor) of toxin-antitoxin stability system